MEISKYRKIHYWLRRTYGNASKCEFTETCKGISNKYDWALKDGCDHEKKRENYIELCKSCHAIYDKKGVGRKMSKTAREKMSAAKKGTTPVNKGNNSMVHKVCGYCKCDYKAYKSKRKTYCSIECRNLDMIGKPTRNKNGRKGKNND